jgi:hypothetical protein
MGAPNNVDRDVLLAAWSDMSLTRREIATKVGVSHSHLEYLVRKNDLPPRKAQRTDPLVDPTLREIEQRKLELHARHMAARRSESDETTRSKISNSGTRGSACVP